MDGIFGAIWTEPSKALKPDDRVAFRQDRDGGGISLTGQTAENENAGIRVVFSGSIFNAEPLRRELLAKDRRFQSDGVAEILVHLFEEEGIEMARRLNGLFALAIWSEKDRRLFLARDHIGKRLLFYRTEPGRLLFADALKSILAVPGVPRDIDPTALDDYLTYQYIPHPKTIFRNVAKLPPGHFAVWRDGALSVTRYWNIDWNTEERRYTATEWSEQLRALVTDAALIRLQGESDAPIGAFLSGGVDSTIMTGLVRQESSRPIQTFSIGFEHKEYDESLLARRTAERLGTQHRELLVTSDIENLLPKLVWHYDEPFADSSAIPTWFLCEMAGKHVRVAVSGDGGDELFAGYDRYKAVRLGQMADKIPAFLRRALAGPVRNMIPASTQQRSWLRRVKRFLEALGMAPVERYLQWIAIFNAQRRDALYTDALKQTLRQADSIYDSSDFLHEARAACLDRDRVTQTSLMDVQTYLPCDVMTKVDIASGANGLECRAPLLDYRVIEFAAKMPLRHKMRGTLGKIILRDTFRKFLPQDVDQRPKRGFGVPLDHWFRGPLKTMTQDLLLDQHTLGRGWFRRDALENMLNEHFSNRFDHAYRIWALLFLELWMRQWLDDKNCEDRPCR